jgi:hypothetical protein
VLSTGDWYLPDFLIHLKDRSMWVEIKPDGIPALPFEQFMRDIKQPGTVLHEIPDPESICGIGYEFFDEGGYYDCPYRFCVCDVCGAVRFRYSVNSKRFACDCEKGGETYDHPKILQALTAARSARFETGS